MKIEINNNQYNIIINRKITNKHTYIRINKNLEIVVNTSLFTSDKTIINLINNNIEHLEKNIEKEKERQSKNKKFLFLGKEYDLIIWNNKKYQFGDNKIFINDNTDIEKIYQKEAKIIFKEHLDKIYNNFKYKIDYPTLTIRKMTSRWGVCNTKTKRITLNLNLIRMDTKYLDYVIVHELSHLIHANHSKNFWNVVGEHIENYKEIRREMKDE